MEYSLCLSSVKDEGKSSDFCNRFDGLDVEDITDDLETMMTTSVPPLPTRPTEHACYLDEDKQAEKEADEVFRGICFFKDLHDIEEEILQTWKTFIDGQVSLSIAAISTQAGLVACRQLVNDLRTRDDGDDEKHGLDPGLLLSFAIVGDAKKRCQDENNIGHFLAAECGQDDFVYIRAIRTLWKFSQAVGEWYESNLSWPPSVPFYQFATGLDPKAPYADSRDDYTLTQLLLELQLMGELKAKIDEGAIQDRNGISWVEDELMKSTRTLCNGDTSFGSQTMFTCQIVMDILKLCGNKDQPLFYENLLKTAKETDEIFGFSVDEENFIHTDGFKVLDTNEKDIGNVFHLVWRHIPNPGLIVAKGHWLSQRPDLRLLDQPFGGSSGSLSTEHRDNDQAKVGLENCIPPSMDPKFLLTHNPLHCGSLGLDLAISTEKAGISLANIHGTIFAAAHLYNAVRQLHAVELVWPEMDRVMAIHKAAFFANDVPTTPEEMWKRLHYRAGFHEKIYKSKRSSSWQMQPCEASGYLKQLIDCKSSVDHVFTKLETYLEGRKAVRKSQSQQNRQLNPRQFMRRLQELLPEVMADIEIDYIGLTKKCTALINAIRVAVTDNSDGQGIVLPDLGHEETLNVEHFYMVHEILKGNDEEYTAHQKQKRTPDFHGGAALRITGTVFDKFYKTHVIGDAAVR